MKEYNIEHGRNVELSDLVALPLEQSSYEKAHEGLVIPCHDIVIQYQGGALLVTRKKYPAYNMLFPIGGRIQRGLSTEQSLRNKVREECGLEISNIIEFPTVRAFWNTDPFGHGKGTDNIILRFYGKGEGKLCLDGLHENPKIVMPENYTQECRESLHPYVQDFLDLAMPIIKLDL